MGARLVHLAATPDKAYALIFVSIILALIHFRQLVSPPHQQHKRATIRGVQHSLQHHVAAESAPHSRGHARPSVTRGQRGCDVPEVLVDVISDAVRSGWIRDDKNNPRAMFLDFLVAVPATTAKAARRIVKRVIVC